MFYEIDCKQGLLIVSGKDAKQFLQGFTTCDLDKLTVEKPLIGLFANLQGRVVATFRVFLRDDQFILRMPQPSIAHTLEHLKKYSRFSKVNFEISDQFDHLNIPNDPDWRYHDIQAGFPNIYPETQGMFLPHELNFHTLGGIDFKKGCYLGQEIIARMHYRGKLKYEMVLKELHPENLSDVKLVDAIQFQTQCFCLVIQPKNSE